MSSAKRERSSVGPRKGSVLDLMLFNILIDDLFFHVKRAKLNTYADDHLLACSAGVFWVGETLFVFVLL